MPPVLGTQAAIVRASRHTICLRLTRMLGEDKIAEPMIGSRIRPKANIEFTVLRTLPV
jgi:hypothetical protein